MELISSDSEQEIPEVVRVPENTTFRINIIDRKNFMLEYVLKKGKVLPYERDFKGR